MEWTEIEHVVEEVISKYRFEPQYELVRKAGEGSKGVHLWEQYGDHEHKTIQMVYVVGDSESFRDSLHSALHDFKSDRKLFNY